MSPSQFHAVSPARQIAYSVLRRVETGQDFAADLLRAPSGASLSERDQNLATELVLGTLRRRAELDFWITRLSERSFDYFDPEIVTILRLGIYQIRLLRRIPKSAVVNDAVEMAKRAQKRSASGLVNAVLRKCEPMNEAAGTVDADSLRLALPAWIGERWSRRFGAEAQCALARWSLETPRTAVRVADADAEAMQRKLEEEGIEAKPALYAPEALIVGHGRITRSKLWKTGQLVLQDEASQLVGSLVRPEPGQRVLDLCAAPGMKTTQIADVLGQGLLVACDRSAPRLRGMVEIGRRPVTPFAILHRVRLDASFTLPFSVQFDRILLDAPCSGTGTLSRNPEIKWRLRAEDIARLAAIQARMLFAALGALAPGGRLVYATCSLEPEEQEGVVEKVLQEKRAFRLLDRAEVARIWPALDALFDAKGYFRTRPDLHSADGFFAAIITRCV